VNVNITISAVKLQKPAYIEGGHNWFPQKNN